MKEKMKENWVDFKVVKQAVTIRMVLDHYGVNWLREKGNELRGRCPIHKGEGTGTFHANTDKNAFQCFSCKARGNVLDFVAAMEQCSVRDAAVKLSEWYPIGALSGVQETQHAKPDATEATVGTSGGEGITGNVPLKFQLKHVEPEHPYLAGRGITKDIAAQYGIGFNSGKGSLAGRVVIPIHNEHGELLAYAGRSIDVSEPKYMLPAGFKKSLVLYNLSRVVARAGERVDTVVIVEGFFGCIAVELAGFPCVGLIGSSLSEHQERLLREHFTGALLLFDGNEAGRSCTDDCLRRLGCGLWVTAVVLPEEKQPDHYTAGNLLNF